jgi:hypothetical protein
LLLTERLLKQELFWIMDLPLRSSPSILSRPFDFLVLDTTFVCLV